MIEIADEFRHDFSLDQRIPLHLRIYDKAIIIHGSALHPSIGHQKRQFAYSDLAQDVFSVFSQSSSIFDENIQTVLGFLTLRSDICHRGKSNRPFSRPYLSFKLSGIIMFIASVTGKPAILNIVDTPLSVQRDSSLQD